MSLLREELLDKQFYRDSMSLALQNSMGMIERCDMYADILKNVDDISEDLFNRLDIYYYKSPTDNYFSKNKPSTMSMSDYMWSTTDYYLDLIGQLIGVSRNLILNGASTVLCNYDFLLYIQARYAENRFGGDIESILKIYTGSSIPNYAAYTMGSYSTEAQNILKESYKETMLSLLRLQYVLTPGDSSFGSQAVDIYWTLPTSQRRTSSQTIEPGNYTDNTKMLYSGGYLTILPLGISATYHI